MTGYVTVWGERVDHDDATLWYVCEHCGAELDSYGYDSLRCRGCEHHIITDHRGLQNRPEKKRAPEPEIYLAIDGQRVRLTQEVKDKYCCARCGHGITDIRKDGTLHCSGWKSHPIRSDVDLAVRPRYFPTREDRERHDAEQFASWYQFWNQGEGTMAGRLKDRKTISHGLKRAGKIRLGYFTQLRDEQGKPKVYKSGKRKGQPIEAPPRGGSRNSAAGASTSGSRRGSTTRRAGTFPHQTR